MRFGIPVIADNTPGYRDAKHFQRLWVLIDLTKLKISVLSTMSGATGHVIFCRGVNPGIITVSLGILLLAMGACAMNQFQDRAFDARMERTRHRPIPSGAMKPATAFAIAAFLDIAGFLLLWLVHNLTAALIGLFAVLWYNGIYTYLKRVWAFAVVPGGSDRRVATGHRLDCRRREPCRYARGCTFILLFHLADTSFLASSFPIRA